MRFGSRKGWIKNILFIKDINRISKFKNVYLYKIKVIEHSVLYDHIIYKLHQTDDHYVEYKQYLTN